MRIEKSVSRGLQTSSRTACLRPSLSANDRLDSWKEIAAFLKRTVRTVQRWEKAEGLPVHRHVHDHHSSVYAHRSQLDAWWTSESVSAGRAQAIDSAESFASLPATSIQKSTAQAKSTHPDILPYKLRTNPGSNGRPRQIELILIEKRIDPGVLILLLIDISRNGPTEERT